MVLNNTHIEITHFPSKAPKPVHEPLRKEGRGAPFGIGFIGGSHLTRGLLPFPISPHPILQGGSNYWPGIGCWVLCCMSL